MNWNDKLGIREGLGCLLVFAAGAKLYISMILYDTKKYCQSAYLILYKRYFRILPTETFVI